MSAIYITCETVHTRLLIYLDALTLSFAASRICASKGQEVFEQHQHKRHRQPNQLEETSEEVETQDSR